MLRTTTLVSLMSALAAGAVAGERPPLPSIVLAQDYEAARASSWDRSGANRDFKDAGNRYASVAYWYAAAP